MAWLIFWMKLRYIQTRDELYIEMSRFWIRVVALSFAVGVATGIVMEFEFGTNWAGYSRYVGDIFGAPLAAEGILAFFLESSFLGVLLFGEKKISPRGHLLASFMVAFGATLSAFWIIVANSWQQTPTGYAVVNGHAEMTDFAAVIFSSSMLPRLTHTISGALTTGAFIISGISAWYLLRDRHLEFAKRSLAIAMVAGFIASTTQVMTGHNHAVQVAKDQPAKLAAFEGLFETTRRAPLLLFGIPNQERREVDLEIAMPGFLSFLVDMDFNAEVQGLDAFPEEEWPPVLATFVPFHAMFGLGMCFLACTAVGCLLLWTNRLFKTENKLIRLFLWGTVIATPFPIVANSLGWIAAELGRQPWVVYNVLKTEDAVSASVPASYILASIIMFVITYALLLSVFLFTLRKKILHGPELEASDAEEAHS